MTQKDPRVCPVIVRLSAFGATRQSNSAHTKPDTRVCTHSVGVVPYHWHNHSEALNGSMPTGPQQKNISSHVSVDAEFASSAGAHHADLMKDFLDPCHPGDCHPAYVISPQVSGAHVILKGYSAQWELTPDIRSVYPHSYFASLQWISKIGQAFM